MKKIRKYIVKIMGLALDVNNKGKYTVFVNFSGHVNQLCIYTYKGKWTKIKKTEWRIEFYLDEKWDDAESKSKEIIKKLKLMLNDAPCNLDKEASKSK